jgi:hypothetical protein
MRRRVRSGLPADGGGNDCLAKSALSRYWRYRNGRDICPGIAAASWPSLYSISDGLAVTFQREVNTAWDLALTAKPHLDAGERNYAFVKIGAGRSGEAVRIMA